MNNPEANNLEARRKTWHGNFAGFRIFRDGKMVINHVNALREDEAIEKALHILHLKTGISKDSWCDICDHLMHPLCNNANCEEPHYAPDADDAIAKAEAK